jgi:RND family efflux transporter MFP subunit
VLAAGLFALAACGNATAPTPAPSVLVKTVTVRMGTMPEVAVVYGTATPATGAVQTLNLEQPAVIRSIAVVPGVEVRAGQQLLDYTLAPGATSAYQQAVAALRLAQEQRAHVVRLLEQQLATMDQLAQADAAVIAARTNLDALVRQGAATSAGSLRAPFDGFVVAIAVSAGDLAQSGAPLITLARTAGVVVTTGFSVSDAARLRAGQPATLESLSNGSMVDGHVTRVAARLNPRTGFVDADLAPKAGSVIAGDAFRALVTIGQLNGWLAPHIAVLNDQQGDYVFQVASGKAKRVAVRLVGISGNIDVVSGPLDARLPLVTDGAYQLQDGMAVRSGGPS